MSNFKALLTLFLFEYSNLLFIVVIFFSLVGNSPFLGDSDSETVKNISNMIWDYECLFFTNCSDDAIDFLKRLIVYEKKYLDDLL